MARHLDLYVRRRPPSSGGPGRHPMTSVKELGSIMRQRGNQRVINAEIRQRAARMEKKSQNRLARVDPSGDTEMIEVIDDEYYDEL